MGSSASRALLASILPQRVIQLQRVTLPQRAGRLAAWLVVLWLAGSAWAGAAPAHSSLAAGPSPADSSAASSSMASSPMASSSMAEGDDTRAGLFLYPDIHEDFVVFVHGEDLWRAPAEGGQARRLTSHEGQELFPKISPDGRWIAFSAQYTGSRQVWVMPAEGGAPRQLTFYTDVGAMPPRGGYDYWILDWTPDGKILVRANRTPFGQRMGRYHLVDPEGGLETPLPIAHGGTATYSPDGSAIAYTPVDREFRTWKHSRGGRAQDLWIYDFGAEQSRRLTTYTGTDNFPMWVGDTIYFTSDRDFTLELFAYDLASEQVRQLTDAGPWDLVWPSAGPSRDGSGQIVFGRGGDLHRMSIKSEKVTPIEISIGANYAHTVPRFEDASDNTGGTGLSPSGKRVAIDARGDIFTVPAENGPTRNLTRTSGVRERDPAWSPDGRFIAYLSDATGEYELYIMPQDGSSEPRMLTEGGSEKSITWRFTPSWSPDSKRIAFADRNRHLHVLEVDSGKQTRVDTGFRGDLRNHVWSPDGRWLAYERTREESRIRGLSLYSLDTGEIHRLGDGLTADFSPAWSADGKYLFFLSNRDYNLRRSSFEFDYIYDQATRIYVAALDPEAPALFPPESDEEEPADGDDSAETAPDDEGEKGQGKKNKGKKSDRGAKKSDSGSDRSADEAPSPRLDPDGFQARTVALPNVGSGTYFGLGAVEGAVLYLQFPASGPPSLERYDLEKRKSETVVGGARGYELSADGKRVLYVDGGGWAIADAKPGGGESRPLDLSGLRVKLDPQADWRQMLDDAWRITRDWFYDPNMHGMDWQAIGERYRSLLPRISHRSELDWILSEMVGELGAGHTYVQAGEIERPERVGGGMLGAELRADESGYYRIHRIYDGENWHDEYRSPLTEPGVVVEEGEFLLAIDGEALEPDDNPYRLLEGKAETQVRLTVNDVPSFDGAREIVVQTLGSELRVRYIDWVKNRMEMVDRLSNGRIGYVHLPNTAIDGNRMLQKLFYGQAEKEALIIDDRYNGGGFIPDQMIEYLSRTNMAYWAMRGIDSMRTPGFAHDGPKVMLTNGYSSSGGDALPYFFRQQGLGKLIGTRTWGGLIGLNGNPALVDGGSVAICTFRIYDSEGNWVVENEGVTPDIEVFDTPERFHENGDPTIEKAVEVLLEELEANPVERPRVPTPPDLSAPR